MKTKILHRHRENCASLENVDSGFYDGPWFMLGDDRKEGNDGDIYMSKNGAQKRGCNERWLLARCRDPRCCGTIAVRENDILATLPHDGFKGDIV